ncbi:ATP phosphoribosyltransferase [Ceratobasidium sp. AG-Ba]|nr:ATP phosphoribosyltransferase [Ceratobasidium sp. AG-Ba]QRW06206.1 ATP phosphoribosyltransferase [Ceratobasidium sp. AG-Ba]
MHLFTDSIKGRLLFAIPKKGRLYEKSLALLAGADIQYTRSHRLDVCLVTNLNVALVFLPAADIPRFVGEGNVDLGITGQDVILEAEMENHTRELLPLGFGKCKLQVQVPEHSSIKSEVELAGKRVVTSFEILANKHFAKIDIAAGRKEDEKTKIEYIGGSVEAACALGLADGIVDLVESGETMRAAGLHAISTLMTSEAVLITSSKPKHPDLQPLLERITSRIAGFIASQKYLLCQYNIHRSLIPEATKITPGRRAATISPLEDGEWVAVSSMVERAQVADVMDRLRDVGAEDVLIIKLNNCRV